MRFALLGTDPHVLALTQAAIHTGHAIVWSGDVRSQEEAEVPDDENKSAEDWHMLLDPDFCDGVIVGRGNVDPIVWKERLQKLLENQIPVLVSLIPSDSVLTFHELDMVRREKHTLVHHYLPDAAHPWISQLHEWRANGHPDLGRIQQITFERAVQNSESGGTIALLECDVELVQRLVGSIQTVTAFGTGMDSKSLAVQLIGPANVPVRWSMSSELTRITFEAERGRWSVFPADPPARWSVDASGKDLGLGETGSNFSPGAEAIEEFVEAIELVRVGTSAEPLSTWEAATEAMEVVDAVELSLQKQGRRIEVIHQQLSEDLSFKGTMSAVGCALLVFGTISMLLAAMLGKALHIANWWPSILLAGLTLFLLLQLLPKLLKARE